MATDKLEAMITELKEWESLKDEADNKQTVHNHWLIERGAEHGITYIS